MNRLFPTHTVREQQELSECLWEFTPLSGPDAGKSRPVFVPGCWESLPGFRNDRGEGIYRRHFVGGGNLRLVFEGVSHTVDVLLDGVPIAHHYNAYTPFSPVVADVTPGDHLLEVRVDNRFGPESALHIPNDYMTYGGITRPVVLQSLSAMYLKYVHYTPFLKDGQWHCRVSACVAGIGESTPLEVAIQLGGSEWILGTAAPAPGDEVILEGTISPENIQPWSPESPVLYKTSAFLKDGSKIVDDLLDRIGFRMIEIREGKILLNEKPLQLRGLCRHEDWEGFGCALTPALMQQDLAIFRDLGANAVRTTHYPNDQRFLDLCDEQGFLVWEENHARGLVEADMRNPNFQSQCQQCNFEMVHAHYNHPSIFIWGILNECASETEYGRTCYESQLRQLCSLDQSRPLTFATCRFHHNEHGEEFVLDDICMDLPDVASFNLYPLWYFDCPVSRFLEQIHTALNDTPAKNKPFIVSEIGAGAEYGFHADAEEKWSEEYQAWALQEQLTAVFQDPRCTGVFIWQYADVRVSREWFARRPRSHNNKGIVDELRRPKLAYGVVRRIFREAASK